MSFSKSQLFPSVVMSWIRLLGFPSYIYKRKILIEIWGVIGRVAKLDMNTDNKNSVSEIWSLANGCFHCRRYGHVKEACPYKSTDPNTGKEMSTSDSSPISRNMVIDRTGEKSESFGPWMLVEKKSQHKSRESRYLGIKNSTKNIEGSRFRALIDSDINEENNSTTTNVILRNQSNKGKEIVLGNSQGGRFLQQKLDESASGLQFNTSHNLGFKNIANQCKIKSMVNKTINRPESSTNKVASQDRINTGPTKTTENGDLVAHRGSSDSGQKCC
ncbi:hypothetical protein Gogos_012685 [Gossypium gossypioides]|uniref:CCHC-type domain-containing protein n=1 Tax=Gossypium gossypioides TaxID=34282 RepID=A0A7J9BTC6_GOSGO|nr:hypothetical protein [Gossypium gossypioides]